MGRGRLAASHGMQQAISTPAPPKVVANLPPIYHKLDWAGHQALMTAMGQAQRSLPPSPKRKNPNNLSHSPLARMV